MQSTMNEQIRQAMRDAIEAQGTSQNKIADALDTNQPNVNRLLAGRSGKIPDLMHDVLEHLKLELMAIPADKVKAVKKLLAK